MSQSTAAGFIPSINLFSGLDRSQAITPASRDATDGDQLDHLPVKALAVRAIVNLGNGSMLIATELAAGSASPGGRGSVGRKGSRALSNQAVTIGAAREARLDFFRGIAMFIIFIAHLPLNPWNNWIPARFGPSDATEMFVFCSGFASAIAFGGSFRRHGFVIGSLRIAHRCWQVYWSHLGLFLTVATIAVLGTWWSDSVDYVHALYLQHFFAEPDRGIVGLVTLTYVPNYFDILPMYIVVLAMVPAVMALARLGPRRRSQAASRSIWLSSPLPGTCRRSGGRTGPGSSIPSAGS